MIDVRDGTLIRLLDAHPATGPNEILLVVATNQAVHEVKLEAPPDLSDQQVIEWLQTANLTD